MNGDLVDALATAMSVLTRENAALAALDLEQVASFAPAKAAVTTTLMAIVATHRDDANTDPERLISQIRDIMAENRRLLERAIEVQKRVLGIVASAASSPNCGTRYARTGSPTRSGGPAAFAVQSRA
jgi:hypothetical protein